MYLGLPAKQDVLETFLLGGGGLESSTSISRNRMFSISGSEHFFKNFYLPSVYSARYVGTSKASNYN